MRITQTNQNFNRFIGMKIDCDGELAYTTIEWSEFVETGAISADTEDLVNECLKVSGTKGAFIAIEQQNRQVKVSFRSRLEALNVAAVAEKFTGGGHRVASGATLAGPFPVAVSRALEAMKEAILIARGIECGVEAAKKAAEAMKEAISKARGPTPESPFSES